MTNITNRESTHATPAASIRRRARWPIGVLLAVSCLGSSMVVPAADQVRLITLDPGHFHAGLVQKFMYPDVSPVVRVYAPEGPDLREHLERIRGFNTRVENPTHWDEQVYTGPDFLQRMVRDKAGNVVVLAGNNLRKTEYIDRSMKAGFNVLGDKPMAINPSGFRLLRKDFDLAARKKLLLYDIMTERYEIASMVERELARKPDVFGTFEKGTAADPAVVMQSVHHFYKDVAGKPLIRPAWFFDPRQQGEAIPDVGTHLVDLVQWECFPGQALDWKQDIKVLSAHRWPTHLTTQQFQRVTGLPDFPRFLQKDVQKLTPAEFAHVTGQSPSSDPEQDRVLNVFENGDVTYCIRGLWTKVTALWRFEAPPGAKDTHHSRLRGTRATLTIEQGEPQHFEPTLYVENRGATGAAEFERSLKQAIEQLCATWPGLDVKASGNRWEILIPQKYKVGHEAHFAQVTEKFLGYLRDGNLPDWEVPNMLAKYYTTTEAYRLSHQAQH